MKYLITTILAALFIWNCSDDTAVQPTSGFQFDARHGIVVTDTLFPKEEKFILKDPPETGSSPFLSLGRTNDFEAYFLIKFSELPADTVTLDSITLRLRGFNALSLTEQQQISVEIHRLSEDWDVSVNTVESWRNYSPGAPYKTVNLELGDSLTHEIALDNDLVAGWQNEDQNFGLLFRAADMENQVIREFGSFNSDNSHPELLYKSETGGNSSYDTLAFGIDATVFKYTGTIFEEEKGKNNLVISSGVASRALYKFDYSSISGNAIISKADLILPVEEQNELLNPNKSQLFYLRSIIEVEDDLTIDSTISYDFNVNYVMQEDGDQLVLPDDDAISFGQGYIQALVNGNLNHEWYSVQYINESSSLSLIKLTGTEAASVRRPRLVVTYLRVE